MNKAISDLMNDHEVILTALEVFARILSKLQNTPLPDENELSQFIDFLVDFADQCHHGKEEGFLFPAMVAFGVPDRGGPIGVMMVEHIQGRGYIHDLRDALDAEPFDLAGFELAGRKYIDLLRMHIHKENSVLFPMADKIIPLSDLDRLCESFSEHEAKFDCDESHVFLANLQSKYPA